MRPKSFLTYFILCAIPLLLLAALNYWNGVSTANSMLGTILQNDLNSFNGAVDEVLKEREKEILGFAIKPVVQNLLSKKQTNEIDPVSNYEQMLDTRMRLKSAGDFSDYFQSLTLFTNDRRPLCFQKAPGEWTFASLDSANLPQPEQEVWTSPGNRLFENAGNTPIVYSAPVNDEKTGANLGAVVGVLDLQRVFASASRGLKSRSNRIVVTDRTGTAVYTSNGDLSFDSTYQTASALIPLLGVATTVARQRSDFMSGTHRWGITGLVIALLFAAAAAFFLERHVSKP